MSSLIFHGGYQRHFQYFKVNNCSIIFCDFLVPSKAKSSYQRPFSKQTCNLQTCTRMTSLLNEIIPRTSTTTRYLQCWIKKNMSLCIVFIFHINVFVSFVKYTETKLLLVTFQTHFSGQTLIQLKLNFA